MSCADDTERNFGLGTVWQCAERTILNYGFNAIENGIRAKHMFFNRFTSTQSGASRLFNVTVFVWR